MDFSPLSSECFFYFGKKIHFGWKPFWKYSQFLVNVKSTKGLKLIILVLTCFESCYKVVNYTKSEISF